LQLFGLQPGALALLLYIDPNSGGLLVQLLVPAFVAIGAGWVFFKKKVATAANRLFRRSKGATE
jgi:hypothetical protein